MDTVSIYDTQQAGPVCLLTKLHYDEFTDMSWYAGLCNGLHLNDSDPFVAGPPMASASSSLREMGTAQ